jgi:hypothetical protein
MTTEKGLNHRARLEACLTGQIPDRAPVALWRHFPVDDQTPTGWRMPRRLSTLFRL